ncbi:MAG: altronate dehydratase [Clostridia bacterium]|nr:altronate dehydratase [Clostridia bacterium]
MEKIFKINNKDNVAVALKDLSQGDTFEIDRHKVILKDSIPNGHKVALKDIEEGEHIIKYGYSIGHATQKITSGQWVHVHNINTNLLGIDEYKFNKDNNFDAFEQRGLTFKGYIREDGSVGIRNELWIIPTIGCINGIAEQILNKFKAIADISKIDALEVFKHSFGCSQLGQDELHTRTILQNIAKHPNAGGVLVLGLGCENNYVEAFKKTLGQYNEKRIRFLVAQEVKDEISEGMDILQELYENMLLDIRREVPISELKVGLKCGGSDGLSGITANPLLGRFSDFLVSQGGTTVLTEVPEMFGAETMLMNRCVSVEIFNKAVSLINDFKEYFLENNQPVYENPSQGNKAGGLSTLEDKSLGCIQKAGTAPVTDVLEYGGVIAKKGLNLLSAPGNDLVATTALGAAGCQLVLFTTGRGTPFGSFVPTMKISTNSQIYRLKKHWIDFNAGGLIEGQSMEVLLEEFIQYIIRVASGEFVNNEKNGFREITIFKTGVTV